MSFKQQQSGKLSSGCISCNDQQTTIIIGPNGSGKSNILKIIYTCLRAGLFYDYQLIQDDTGYHIIKKSNILDLKPHYDSDAPQGTIILELILSAHDRENIIFMQKFGSTIQDIAKKYSDTSIILPVATRQQLEGLTHISVTCNIDYVHNTMSIDTSEADDATVFAIQCMHYHELIQHCMNIYNTSIRKPDQRSRYPLKQTFALLSSYRDSSYFSDQSGNKTSNQLQSLIESLSHSNQDSLSGNIGRELLQSKLIADHLNKTDTITTHIQTLCNKYIGTQIQLQQLSESDFLFTLKDEQGHTISINELSSGEKSLLHIISTVYGYDMEDGLVLIDEPELHLHPQLQESCIELIADLSKQLHIQWIMATHSPAMINQQTIHNVVRCFWEDGYTNIVQPATKLMEDDGMLFQMLRFSNVAKIFFADILIMVEGDTDEYFFYHFLEYLKHNTSRGHQIQNFEIMNINGKGSYQKRKGFLNKFGIKSAYIGDRDNIMQEIHTDRDGVHSGFHEYIRQQHGNNHVSKSKKYQQLISYIKSELSDLYQDIMVKIDNLKHAYIFILTQGDIEAYLGLHEKGIEPTVEFCEHSFDKRLQDHQFESKRNELMKIFHSIFEHS